MDGFIVSARKYRPATFDTVVGQRPITSTLKNAIRNNQLAQAFLFTGPRGVGKTTCARILAKTINCENITENVEACNLCESCLSFNRSHSFNVHELDAASNNSVDGIRNLIDQVRIPPQVGKYKVYIIDEVHMLSPQAFNAFLKTLEEPPAYAKFILATTERHKIIPTILSRCQIFDFARITAKDIIYQLDYVASQEGIDAEQEALHIIAQKADGAMRDALSIFDQLVSFTGNTITYKQVVESLNVLDHDYYFRVLDLILQGKSAEVLLLVNEILMKGFEGLDFITGFGSHLRNLLVGNNPATLELIETSDDVKNRYKKQAMVCEEEFLLQALVLNNRADVQYKTSSDKRLTLELTLLQMVALVKKKPISEPKLTRQEMPPMDSAGKSTPGSKKETPDPPVNQTKEQDSLGQPDKETPEPTINQTKEQDSSGQPDKKQTTQSKHGVVSRPHMPSGISLKIHQSPEQDNEEDDDENDDDSTQMPADVFTAEQFSAIWEELAESHQKESHGLYLAMTKYEPLLNKNGLVVVFLDNAIQEDLIAERKIELLSYLRKSLNNYGIQIETRIKENGFEQKAYLPKEKYEKLVRKNPILTELRKEFDLDFDY